MKIILDAGVFFLLIACSFVVGSMYASKYILHLLEKEGYRKVSKRRNAKDRAMLEEQI